MIEDEVDLSLLHIVVDSGQSQNSHFSDIKYPEYIWLTLLSRFLEENALIVIVFYLTQFS